MRWEAAGQEQLRGSHVVPSVCSLRYHSLRIEKDGGIPKARESRPPDYSISEGDVENGSRSGDARLRRHREHAT
jgi:hypothetical protein